MEPKDRFKIISQTCDKGKHKFRENNFGVVWCVRCGMLSNTMNASKLEKTEITIIENGEIIQFNGKKYK